MSWRRLDRPQPVSAFIQDIWLATVTDLVDDQTREIKVFPPGTSSKRLTLDASRYRPMEPGLFPDLPDRTSEEPASRQAGRNAAP